MRAASTLSPLTTVALAIQNRRRSKALTCSTPPGQRSTWFAAIDYAVERGRVWLVGHSLGGHAMGQLPNPNILGVKQVGHMGYFRSQTGQVLWPQTLGWLSQHGLVLNDA